MRAFATWFYKSPQWQLCRDTYLRSVGGLCEDCLSQGIYSPAVIVHHKTHLSPDNINDPTITLGFDNLRALCRDCHGKAHSNEKRYKVDELGRVII